MLRPGGTRKEERRAQSSSEPPAWLADAARRTQARLDRVTARLGGGGSGEDDREGLSEEEQSERWREQEAAFERKWGHYYKPLVFFVILWLVLMGLWDRL